MSQLIIMLYPGIFKPIEVMKRCTCYFFILTCLAFVACDEEDVAPVNKLLPDTVAPTVAIQAPAANDSLLIIDVIGVVAEVADDKRIENVRVSLAEPGRASQVISDVKVPFSEEKNYTAGVLHRLPKNAAASGVYTLTVEARDIGQNVTIKTVTFSVKAPSVSRATFERSFDNAFYEKLSAPLDWFAYNFWDEGYAFSENWLSTVLYLMVTTSDDEYSISEAEWTKFMADFGMKNQSWAKWDEDNDGNLNDMEFELGISRLGLFKEWDRSKDKIVNLEELATGVFSHWDQNKDNLLAKEEYLEKFNTYLYPR